jgi:hypothetical protein
MSQGSISHDLLGQPGRIRLAKVIGKVRLFLTTINHQHQQHVGGNLVLSLWVVNSVAHAFASCYNIQLQPVLQERALDPALNFSEVLPACYMRLIPPVPCIEGQNI